MGLMASGLMFVFGLAALLYGKFDLLGHRFSVDGRRARIMGLLLMTPLILTFWIMLGQSSDLSIFSLQRWFGSYALVLDFFAIPICLVIAIVILLTAPRKKKAFSLPKALTTAEAAGYLSVPEQDVILMIESGELSASKVGQDYRIDRDKLLDFFQ